MSKTVVITGGNRGIGLCITQAFLRAGFRVYVGSRTIGDLSTISSASLRHVRTDVRTSKEVDKLVKVSYEETGRLDVLINNAGYSEWRAIEDIDERFLEDIISTNLMGAFWGCRAAAAHMCEGGTIINVSSIAGKRGSAKNSAYVATKFGMNGLTQALAKELGQRNIRVNGICPVLVATEGLLQALESTSSPANGDTAGFLDKFARDHGALNRLPSGEDVAAMCLFLVSDGAAAVTGQNINVDCGVFPQ